MRLLNVNGKLSMPVPGARLRLAGLSFAPADRSGVNVCPKSTPGCRAACVLWFGGRTVMQATRDAAVRRTLAFLQDRQAFLRDLRADLRALARAARKRRAVPVVRLNVASDIDWARVAPDVFRDAAALGIKVYDYSKDAARVLRELARRDAGRRSRLCRAAVPACNPDSVVWARGPLAPWNLTLSVSEVTTFQEAKAVHDAGGNLATVFAVRYYSAGGRGRFGEVPATVVYRDAVTGEEFRTRTVDGDKHDARLPRFDGRGVTVALRNKGTLAAKAAAVESGFAKAGAPGWRDRPAKRRRGTAVVVLAHGAAGGAR
ncbi:MAG: hypothetical protein VKP62_16745 [Candidatus Sericytochromatia bacterium]|nr:hypothetical protein [Candidatus Sericytochromatia bacterium]